MMMPPWGICGPVWGLLTPLTTEKNKKDQYNASYNSVKLTIDNI